MAKESSPMDEPIKTENLELSPEELKADEEAMKEVKSDDLREHLATEYGLDPEEDAELLEKIAKRELDHRERLSGAIKQKINWRTKAAQLPKETGKSQPAETPDISKLVSQSVAEALEARDLESMGLPDDLKEEIKDLAKFKGISVREAAQLPYIQNRKAEMEQAERLKRAIPKRTSKGGYTTSIDPSKPLNPADFNIGTPEGAKAWREAREARNKYLAQNQ